MLADRAKMILPKEVITLAVLLPVLCILMLQPDVGQTGLLLALWAALLFFYGVPLKWIGAIAGGGLGLVALAYFAVSACASPHRPVHLSRRERAIRRGWR